LDALKGETADTAMNAAEQDVPRVFLPPGRSRPDGVLSRRGWLVYLALGVLAIVVVLVVLLFVLDEAPGVSEDTVSGATTITVSVTTASVAPGTATTAASSTEDAPWTTATEPVVTTTEPVVTTTTDTTLERREESDPRLVTWATGRRCGGC
jgi:cytoskeletal protein RodZ